MTPPRGRMGRQKARRRQRPGRRHQRQRPGVRDGASGVRGACQPPTPSWTSRGCSDLRRSPGWTIK
eukprot:2200311-Heterocapsa_arctica.AAC.1